MWRFWKQGMVMLALAAAMALWCLSSLAAPGGGGTSRYTLVPLDTRPGYQWSGVNDINESGDAVGWLEDADGSAEAVAWEVTLTGGAVSVAQYALPLPSDQVVVGSDALGVNDFGEIVGNITVVGVDGSTLRTAVYWQDAASPPVTLAPLPGHRHSMATSINNGGLVVGVSAGAIPDTNRHAVAWKIGTPGSAEAEPLDLGTLAGATYSEAADVNNADALGIAQVVGTSGDKDFFLRAVLWEIDVITFAVIRGPVDLGFLRNERPISQGDAINDQGTTCGDSGQIAFREADGGTMQQLVQFKPGQTYAYGINNHNEIVGHNRHYDRRTGVFLGTYGVLWQADGKVVNLDSFIGSSGWYHIHDGKAINESSWIVGHGAIGAPGESRALVIVPK